MGESIEGVIQLASYSECFVADLSTWTTEQYESQWREAARRLVDAESPACFVTSMHDPATAEVVNCWVAYPVERLLVFQETMIRASALMGLGATRDLHSLVRPRQVRTKEGRPISEWSIPRGDMALFLAIRD